jgi:hypothetical protein
METSTRRISEPYPPIIELLGDSAWNSGTVSVSLRSALCAMEEVEAWLAARPALAFSATSGAHRRLALFQIDRRSSLAELRAPIAQCFR